MRTQTEEIYLLRAEVTHQVPAGLTHYSRSVFRNKFLGVISIIVSNANRAPSCFLFRPYWGGQNLFRCVESALRVGALLWFPILGGKHANELQVSRVRFVLQWALRGITWR